MNEVPSYVKEMLDHTHGPIMAQFTLDKIPQGAAPTYYREQWIGTALPVRKNSLAQLALGVNVEYFDFLSFESRENTDPVTIVGFEAIEALNNAGKTEAAEFWLPYQMGAFIFRAHEGQLSPVS